MDILIFIGAIAALIFVHELGHFVVARLLKVEVEEFGLGFPPRLLKLFHWKGTDYTLNWIPLGGFVRMKGENDPDVPGGFMTAKPLVRIAILLAGPAANILVAIVLFAIAFSQIGVPDTSKVLVMEIAPNSPAEMVGMLPGDQILSINGVDASSTLTVQESIRASLEQDTVILVNRNGEQFEVTLVPRSDPPAGEGAIGITMSHPSIPISVWEAVPMGASAVGERTYTLLTLPVDVARGVIAPSDARLVGFKGMYDIYQEVQEIETGPSIPASINLLAFFAMISTSLGILNLPSDSSPGWRANPVYFTGIAVWPTLTTSG